MASFEKRRNESITMSNDKSGSKAQTKAENIFERSTREAKAITDEETAARDEKTERLKQQRLERDAQQQISKTKKNR